MNCTLTIHRCVRKQGTQGERANMLTAPHIKGLIGNTFIKLPRIFVVSLVYTFLGKRYKG